MNLRSNLFAPAVVAVLVGGHCLDASAAFVFSAQNVILNVRPSDASPTDLNLTINLGPVETYRDATQVLPLNSLGANLIDNVFGDLNNLLFSASASEPSAGQDFPQRTVWNTRPRTDLDTQTTPWQRNTALNSSQGATSTKINSIGSNAQNFGVDLSDSATTTVHGEGTSYSSQIGAAGNFGGSFQGSVENATGGSFNGTSSYLRSDFYAMTPGSGNGTYYGFFELQGDGDLYFVPASISVPPGTAVPEPQTYAATLAIGLAGWAVLRRSKSRTTAAK